jgi:hypothetical protein
MKVVTQIIKINVQHGNEIVSVSRPGSLNPKERVPDNRWIGGWVSLRAGLHTVEKRKIGTEFRVLSQLSNRG